MICTYDLSRLEGLLRCMCIGRRSTQLSGACCYAQIVRMSFGRPSNNPLGKRKVDCLETGFASRVDETCEGETDALRKTEFVFHRRSANLHSSECLSNCLFSLSCVTRGPAADIRSQHISCNKQDMYQPLCRLHKPLAQTKVQPTGCDRCTR